MEISIVVAADENNGIGNDNQLLCHLPNDLKYFKRVTSGHAILMGRKTFDSIGRPLPNRSNLVLSNRIKFIEGCEVFSDMPGALVYSEEKGFTHLYIIGGDSIYQQAISFCDTIYLTRIHHVFKADAFFPVLSPRDWMLEQSEDQVVDEKNIYAHTFEVWRRK